MHFISIILRCFSPLCSRICSIPRTRFIQKSRMRCPRITAAAAVRANSVIADGCIIEGEVENSVLFRGVHVGKGAKVKNCILMQATYIGDNSELSYMVLDKGVIVLNGRRLSGHENYPVILRKGVTV